MAHCLRRLQYVETKHRLLFFSASGKNLKKCRLGKPGGRLLTYCLSHGGRLPTDSAVFNQHQRISDVTPPCASSCKNEHFSRTCGTSSQAELIFSLTRGRTLCLFEVGLLPNCVWECVKSKCSIRGGQLPLFAPAGSSSQTATRSSHVYSQHLEHVFVMLWKSFFLWNPHPLLPVCLYIYRQIDRYTDNMQRCWCLTTQTYLRKWIIARAKRQNLE